MRKAQIGPSMVWFFVFILVIVLNIALVILVSSTGFLKRSADAVLVTNTNVNVGDSVAVSESAPEDPFLSSPLQLKYSSGQLSMVPLYRALIVYQRDNLHLLSLRSTLSKASISDRPRLQSEYDQATKQALTYFVLETSLKKLVAKEHKADTCLIIAQSRLTKLSQRISSPTTDYAHEYDYDLFLHYTGTTVRTISNADIIRYYIPVLKTYQFTIDNKGNSEQVNVEYYSGECLEK